MHRVQIVTLEQASCTYVPTGSSGRIEARTYFERPGTSLHLHSYRLGVDDTLELDIAPIDRVVYVWRGNVVVGSIDLPQESSAIIERGTAVALSARERDTIILVFGSEGNPGVARAGGHVHLLPGNQVPRAYDIEGEKGVGGALHSDASCPTCQIWLHEMAFATGDHLTPVHSHSEDEIIFISEGQIRLGNRLYGPGTAVWIAAHTKYGFRTGPEGMRFINFRGSSPTFTSNDGTYHEMDEARFWLAAVGKPPYLNLPLADRITMQS